MLERTKKRNTRIECNDTGDDDDINNNSGNNSTRGWTVEHIDKKMRRSDL